MELHRRRVGETGRSILLCLAILTALFFLPAGYCAETEALETPKVSPPESVGQLRHQVKEGLARISSLEDRLDSLQSSGTDSDQLAELRQSLKAERERVEGMEKRFDQASNDPPTPIDKGSEVLLAATAPPAEGGAQTTASPTPATGSAASTAPAPAAAPAQTNTSPPPAGPTALPTPAITGPLSGLPPAVFDAGPFGKIAVNGIVSGLGMWQDVPAPGDSNTQAALSNGQIFVQKTDGWFQFYLQAGAYTLPALATPFLATDKTMSDFYGPVPVGFIKLQVAKNTSFLIGELPTLIGAEYTFTFENMNIERGLLWNQENAVNRGIQVNQTMGKFTASLSWNDGFYSNRYTWLTGSLTYANGPHSLVFVAGGNYNQTGYQTTATPVQNNSSIYNVIYTYTKGSWIVQPYFQYTNVPTNQKIGIVKGASTTGGAIMVNRTFKHGFSLPVRWEYISSSGNVSEQAVNLMFGPGSAGTSVTLTPTFQYGGFFFRGDLSWAHAMSYTPGDAFGSTGTNASQYRAVGEIGFIFGNNIEKKP
ncbi:MAG TPA: outer membrane beta-barrel protein [Terriglobia bacterium]